MRVGETERIIQRARGCREPSPPIPWAFSNKPSRWPLPLLSGQIEQDGSGGVCNRTAQSLSLWGRSCEEGVAGRLLPNLSFAQMRTSDTGDWNVREASLSGVPPPTWGWGLGNPKTLQPLDIPLYLARHPFSNSLLSRTQKAKQEDSSEFGGQPDLHSKTLSQN